MFIDLFFKYHFADWSLHVVVYHSVACFVGMLNIRTDPCPYYLIYDGALYLRSL